MGEEDWSLKLRPVEYLLVVAALGICVAALAVAVIITIIVSLNPGV